MCSWFQRLDVVNMADIPKLIYKFKIIPIEIPAEFLSEINKLVLKFTWKFKRPTITKSVLRKS